MKTGKSEETRRKGQSQRAKDRKKRQERGKGSRWREIKKTRQIER